MRLIDRTAPVAVLMLLTTACGGAVERDTGVVVATDPIVQSEPIDAPSPHVEHSVLQPADLLILAEVYVMFAEAGQPLPLVPVQFHADVLACGGHPGRQRTMVDGSMNVDVCMRHDIAEIEQIGRRRILMHEMAHVFVEFFIDDTTQRELMELRGLTQWGAGPWEARGAEHAAEIVLWGLTDWDVHVWLDQDSCEELAAGASVLLGSSPRAC